MTAYDFNFRGARLSALPAGILWWPAQSLLCASDLHLGKSERTARQRGTLIPPYEVRDTLNRMSEAIRTYDPATVVCLGDSFDDLQALDGLTVADHKHLASLMAGREWIWIEGNHDAGPVDIGGTHLRELTRDALTFRHIAEPTASGEVSGHFHPKATLRTRGGGITRPCFLIDARRIILPSFGTYTGGLRTRDPALAELMGENAVAVLTGPAAVAVPMPR
jgi:DNA ligase-associated metallophosphoesterase